MTDACTIYVTIDSKKNAVTLLTSLLEARLVACGNIMGPILSQYWWEGKIEEADGEYAIILKTRKSLYEAVRRFIDDHHPYEIPCIVKWDISEGNAPFLDWIASETVV
jgi:periplasmic divalent cation tolerance protein